MAFDALLPFALLLIPGALTQYFYERLRPGTPISSDFERVFRSFLLGWPVLFLNWALVQCLFDLGSDFNNAAVYFGNLPFIFTYFAGTLVFSLGWACALVKLRQPVGKGLSRLAGWLGQTIVLRDSPWDIMFFSNATQAVDVTTPDGVTRKGFVSFASPYSGEDGSKELILTDEDIFEEHAECFATTTRTYVDAHSGTVIREYTMDAYLAKVASAQKE